MSSFFSLLLLAGACFLIALNAEAVSAIGCRIVEQASGLQDGASCRRFFNAISLR